MDDVMHTVRTYLLETVLPGEDPATLTPSMPLVASGILDSLATLELISFLEERYAIEFEAHETDAAHIGTLSDIVRTVQSKLATR